MADESTWWSSGDWHVAEGMTEEFLKRWREFLEWTRAAHDGFGTARLVRDTADPNHFLSFASWRDAEALEGWRGSDEFAERFGRVRVLCDEMDAAGYELVVRI
jgi:heme-degrading monooxygenase HmoA